MSRSDTIYLVDDGGSGMYALLVRRPELGWDLSIKYTMDHGTFDTKDAALEEAVEELRLVSEAATRLAEQLSALRTLGPLVFEDPEITKGWGVRFGEEGAQ